MMLWTAPTLRHQGAIGWLRRNEPLEGAPSMGEVSTIGLDIAKSVFQIHGVDAGGAVVIRKRISRTKLLEFFATLPPCLVGIEACPTAHYWSRRLQTLGHTVRLMPPSYVNAYVKRSQNDANDAAAICAAVAPPAGGVPWRRHDRRDRAGGRGRRLEGVLVGPQPRCVDRLGAETAFDRRQREARQDLKAGQSTLALAARRRRDGCHPICAPARHEAALARSSDGPSADQGCCRCAC